MTLVFKKAQDQTWRQEVTIASLQGEIGRKHKGCVNPFFDEEVDES